MKHLIAKQIINLKLEPQLEAATVQQQFSELFWQDLLPALDQLFDQLALEGEVLEIDQLEIDLGAFQLSELRKDILVPILLKEVEKWFQLNKQSKERIISRSVERNLFKKWLFFLKTGRLPWNLQELEANWETEIIALLSKETAAIQQLKQVLSTNTIARSRLIRQHEANFLQQVISTFTAKKQKELEYFSDQVASVSNTDYEQFWFFVLEKVMLNEQLKEAKQIIEAYKQESANQKNVEFTTLSSTEEMALNLLKTQQQKNENEQLNKTGLYIPNAGIVLVHPFLARFFEKLELLENKSFTPEGLTKAIHLLHYMATNTHQPPEYDLALYKFLCGVPFNLPVARYVNLAKADLEEADALLQAMIEHWGALGKVSNKSLQEGFFQREGKLTKSDTGWRLQIQQKTIDILLNKLPWTTSIIKLPWMKEVLKVDWI